MITGEVEVTVAGNILELVTVIGSDLRELVNPDLILQLNALKSHISIKSFIQL